MAHHSRALTRGQSTRLTDLTAKRPPGLGHPSCNPIEHFRWHPNVARAKRPIQVNTNLVHWSSACGRVNLVVGSPRRLVMQLDVSSEPVRVRSAGCRFQASYGRCTSRA